MEYQFGVVTVAFRDGKTSVHGLPVYLRNPAGEEDFWESACESLAAAAGMKKGSVAVSLTGDYNTSIELIFPGDVRFVLVAPLVKAGVPRDVIMVEASDREKTATKAATHVRKMIAEGHALPLPPVSPPASERTPTAAEVNDLRCWIRMHSLLLRNLSSDIDERRRQSGQQPLQINNHELLDVLAGVPVATLGAQDTETRP